MRAVRINSELGARQLPAWNFDFNCSFQSVESPVVSHHARQAGGIADILPSAITDNPNPAVRERSAYSDVRASSPSAFSACQPSDILDIPRHHHHTRIIHSPGFLARPFLRSAPALYPRKPS
jgi:hypothetical protein